MLAITWADAPAVAAVAAFMAGVVTAIATRAINKAHITGLQESLALEHGNVESLREAQRQQHEECDRQIKKLSGQVEHALAEASAARSDVVKAVAAAATEAVHVANRAAMESAGAVLVQGQQEIIGRLEVIKSAVVKETP